MNYGNPQLQSLLAAEYVLGTLTGAARRRFQRLLVSEPGLRGAAEYWQRRLDPLAESVTPLQPPRRVWRGIHRRIRAGRSVPWLGSGGWLWSRAAMAGLLVLLGYGVAYVQYGFTPIHPRQLQYVAVLQDHRSRPMLVATMMSDGTTLKLDMLNQPHVPAGRVMEVWCLPKGGGKPVSIGMFNKKSGRFELTVNQVRRLHQSEEILVSIEPSGGSPGGAPSGPVMYRGAII